MVEEHPNLIDFRRARPDFLLRTGNVFAVLAASRVRTVGGGDEGKGALNTIQLHLRQRSRQHGMPVAIAPVDRQLRTVLRKFDLQCCNQIASLLVDRTLAVEMIIVLGDREHALARNISSTQYIFEKGNYIFARFGPAKG